jgi:hypothetical protein
MAGAECACERVVQASDVIVGRPHHLAQIDRALLLTGRAQQPQPRFLGEDGRADVRQPGAVRVAVLRVLAPLDVSVPFAS